MKRHFWSYAVPMCACLCAVDMTVSPAPDAVIPLPMKRAEIDSTSQAFIADIDAKKGFVINALYGHSGVSSVERIAVIAQAHVIMDLMAKVGQGFAVSDSSVNIVSQQTGVRRRPLLGKAYTAFQYFGGETSIVNDPELGIGVLEGLSVLDSEVGEYCRKDMRPLKINQSFFSDLGRSCSGISSPAGSAEGQDDEDCTGNAQPESPLRPYDLLLCRARGAPFYAKVILFSVLGALAVVGVNVGGWRLGAGRRDWWCWWLGGSLVACGACLLAFLSAG